MLVDVSVLLEMPLVGYVVVATGFLAHFRVFQCRLRRSP